MNAKQLEGQLRTYEKASANGWIQANDGQLHKNIRDEGTKDELFYAGQIEETAANYGASVTWPGLYPVYRLNGCEYHCAMSFANAAVN